MKTLEEVSETFKEFDEGVVARAHSVSGLRSFEYRSILPAKKGGTHGEEDIYSDKNEFCRLERYLAEKS